MASENDILVPGIFPSHSTPTVDDVISVGGLVLLVIDLIPGIFSASSLNTS